LCPPIEDRLEELNAALVVMQRAYNWIYEEYGTVQRAFDLVDNHCITREQDLQNARDDLPELLRQYHAFGAELLDVEFTRDAAYARENNEVADTLTFTETYETLSARYDAKKAESQVLKTSVHDQEDLIASLERDVAECAVEQEFIRNEYLVQITLRDQWNDNLEVQAADRWNFILATPEY